MVVCLVCLPPLLGLRVVDSVSSPFSLLLGLRVVVCLVCLPLSLVSGWWTQCLVLLLPLLIVSDWWTKSNLSPPPPSQGGGLSVWSLAV